MIYIQFLLCLFKKMGNLAPTTTGTSSTGQQNNLPVLREPVNNSLY